MEHEAGVGPGRLGSAFLLRLPRFLEVSGTRFRAAAGNTYFLAEMLHGGFGNYTGFWSFEQF